MPFSLLHTKVDQSHLKIVAQQEHLRNAQITMDVKLTRLDNCQLFNSSLLQLPQSRLQVQNSS